MSDINNRILELINSSDTFLFMKGTPDKPRCGFSANTCGILMELGVQFNSFDILSDMEMREAIKNFSNWPTYPQLYHKGELVGGNDILTELFNNGELAKMLQ